MENFKKEPQQFEASKEKKEEIERRANIRFGDAALKEGYFDKAREAYELAGEKLPKEKLIKAGDALVERGDFDKAREAYEVAERL